MFWTVFAALYVVSLTWNLGWNVSLPSIAAMGDRTLIWGCWLYVSICQLQKVLK